MGSNRVLRGGSWNNNPQNCRVAYRNNNNPTNRNNNNGFRLVCVPQLKGKAGWLPLNRLLHLFRLQNYRNKDEQFYTAPMPVISSIQPDSVLRKLRASFFFMATGTGAVGSRQVVFLYCQRNQNKLNVIFVQNIPYLWKKPLETRPMKKAWYALQAAAAIW